jgi:glycosyltransferase involved in cell wall biosynthesis
MVNTAIPSPRPAPIDDRPESVPIAHNEPTTPRRVLFLESGLGYGGSAFSLLRLVKSLPPRYAPHVIVSHDAEPFDRIRQLNIPVHTLPLFNPFFGTAAHDRTLFERARNYCSVYGNMASDTFCNGLRIARYIRRQNLNLVHLNNAIGENLCGLLAARLAGVPCVSHVRGTEPLTKVERYCSRWVSAVITLNRSMLRHYTAVMGAQKTHLILNGVDLDHLRVAKREKVRREFGMDPETFAVGRFARLVEGKGIPGFVHIASRVAAEHIRSRFFIIGNDSTQDRRFEARLRRLASELAVDGRLVFTGWRSDHLDLMAAMDVVLQISTTFPEGMSLAPLEAMALAKPVIVTQIPGYELSVDDGRSGFVVAPGAIGAVAEKVLLLARDRGLATRLGLEAQRKAMAQFDIRQIASQIAALYDRVLDATDNRLTRSVDAAS